MHLENPTLCQRILWMAPYVLINRDWCTKVRLAQNFIVTKKSTISCQSFWNLVKMTISRVGKIASTSAWLDENCGFFTDVQIWASQIFLHQSQGIFSLFLNHSALKKVKITILLFKADKIQKFWFLSKLKITWSIKLASTETCFQTTYVKNWSKS